jgi:hypothetical protein
MSVPTSIEEFERIQVFTMKISLAEYHRTFKTVKDGMGFFRTQRRVPLPTLSEQEQKAKAEAEAREKLKKELRSEIAVELAKSVANQPEPVAPAAKSEASDAGTAGVKE